MLVLGGNVLIGGSVDTESAAMNPAAPIISGPILLPAPLQIVSLNPICTGLQGLDCA